MNSLDCCRQSSSIHKMAIINGISPKCTMQLGEWSIKPNESGKEPLMQAVRFKFKFCLYQLSRLFWNRQWERVTPHQGLVESRNCNYFFYSFLEIEFECNVFICLYLRDFSWPQTSSKNIINKSKRNIIWKQIWKEFFFSTIKRIKLFH